MTVVARARWPELRVPGDKSISQRALILASIARGESRIRGILPQGDPASTAGALRALGAGIPGLDTAEGDIRILGRGLRSLLPPGAPIDLRNSGTGARLLLGVLAGQPMEAVLTGDASLRQRPMARVTGPLSAMGARFEFLEAEGRLPLRIKGGSLRSLSYVLPVASAQVKSSLLLAGLVGGVDVRLTEPGRSRDHTERMLRSLGVSVGGKQGPDEWEVVLMDPPGDLPPLDLQVPGDFSSAAFLVLLGLLSSGREEMVLRRVGLNPTRTGLLRVLERMGARLEIDGAGSEGVGEPVGDLVVHPGPLASCVVGREEIPALIDEIPILAMGAARAEGVSRITGARELRVKETDRIRALVQDLRSLGVRAEELEDGLEVEGTEGPLKGTVRSFGDHRIAMAFGVLGALPGNSIEIVGKEAAGVSFPGFWGLLAIAANAMRGRELSSSTGGGRPRRPPIITLDGPAGSGKSTTAREVARRLGFRHLDSGALYRALTVALLRAEIPEEEWPSLPQQALDRFRIWLKPADSRFQVCLGDEVLESELRTPAVTARVSPLSALPAVRAWLLETQRRSGVDGGLVADGRDMGTVVFPEAEVKIFLTAHLDERARRRFLEREGRGPSEEELEEEKTRIRARDTRDSGRAVAPLRKADDALEIDTSDLGFEEQVQLIIDHVKTLTAR